LIIISAIENYNIKPKKMKRTSTLFIGCILLLINASAQGISDYQSNNSPAYTVMPLTLTAWEGNKDGSKVILKWALAETN